MHTIYLDILFCVNFIIDYMILVTVKKFLYLSCRLRRLILGAAVGGLSSFVILLPPMPSGFSMIISFASACFVIGSAFAPLTKKVFLKAAGVFFLISFGYCGIMIAIWLLFTPDILVIRNSSVYIAISPLVLVVTSLFCYVIMQVILRITGKGKPEHMICTVKMLYNGREITFKGYTDTGNILKEPFSGIPVIVAKKSLFRGEFCGDKFDMGMRLIPFSSVGGDGLLQAFKAENISIITQGMKRKVIAYIALCDDSKITGEEDAVIPFELIS